MNAWSDKQTTTSSVFVVSLIYVSAALKPLFFEFYLNLTDVPL